MKIHSSVLGIILLLHISASAQVVSKSSLLWQISGNGLKQPSYLYGTIHTIEKRYYFISDAVLQKFNECRVLATENATYHQYISAQAFTRTEKRRFLPAGQAITQFMTPADSAFLCSYLIDSLNVSRKTYKWCMRVKPFYLGGFVIAKKLKLYDIQMTGYEQEFYQMADHRNKSRKNPMIVLGLEDYKTTLAAIDSIPIDMQIQDLIRNLTMGDILYKKIIDAYRHQDVAALYTLSLSDELTDYFLLVKRNLNWMSRIEKLVNTQSSFIAVGAAHLDGEYGLINLLRASGYTVTPIQSNKMYYKSAGVRLLESLK